MNFPNKVMKHAFLSKQDKDDLLFGIKNEVDYVAASFVSTKQDVACLLYTSYLGEWESSKPHCLRGIYLQIKLKSQQIVYVGIE